eukprot:CAMPEP_0168247670 /NCGR_PEP_ID=MMETSP0141_2-20121125/1034_1 /TAXON_ID=44445 /ORGANISM="Pseudo-nitzschia australis, Strain 10249 10 AB" /LENGTH=538 /DNA_ID=CAMNT_0008183497 /DNA_START=216 /DNA_END=1833 /DNA_ORIENTATION=+
MNFSLAILSFFATASVQGASLRAVANNNNGKILDSEVILKGTVGEPTTEDMEFIGKAFVASYNNVHWEVGHYMTGSHAVDFKGPDSFLCRHCPDDDSMGGAATTSVFEVKTPVGFLCRHCPDDDAMGTDSLLMTAVTKDCAGLCKKDAAAELEINFCNKIRSAQGSKYLGSAKSCAIRFDVDGKKSNNNKRVSSVTNKVATVDSTIILKGVGAGDATKEEQAILAKAFVSAYNDVHWGANHYLADAEIPFTAATGNPDGFLCRHCPDDDSMGGASSSTTSVFEVKTPVGFLIVPSLPDDDAMGNDSLLMTAVTEDCAGLCKKDAAAKLEVNFCNKIRSAKGSEYLSSAKSCDIRFDVENEKNGNKNKRVSSATNTVATIGSTIILKGVGAGNATTEEQAILAKAFVSTYNDVHWGANHYLTDAEIPFTAATGSPDGFLCRHCPDDDAMGGAMQTNTLILDIVSPVEAFLCRHCPDDDAMGSQFNLESLNSSAFDKKAIEVAFCNKIQNSVSNKLANTKSCSIAVESVMVASTSSSKNA